MLFWLIGCFFTAFFLGDRAAREKSKKIIRNDIEVGPFFSMLISLIRRITQIKIKKTHCVR